MKYLKYLFVFLICGASFSAMGQAESSHTNKADRTKTDQGMPALDWRFMYFSGFTKAPVKEIDLSSSLVKSLLSKVGVGAAISTGAAVEPRYIINSKGMPVWLALLAGTYISQPDALEKIHAGKMGITMPASYLNEVYGEHVNWPKPMIMKYDLSLGEHNLFIIPFLIPKDGSKLTQLSRSMQAPDGSFEIIALHEFHDSHPEAMLVQLAGLTKYIKENGPSSTKVNN